MQARLFVCQTCCRYASNNAGEPTPGQKLHQACREAAQVAKAEVVVRAVECLNGCLHACMAALSTPGRNRVRLSDLCVDDAHALIEAAIRHASSATGELEREGTLPERLKDKIAGPPVPITGRAVGL